MLRYDNDDLVRVDGRLWINWDDRLVPAIAGADPEDDGDDGDDDKSNDPPKDPPKKKGASSQGDDDDEDFDKARAMETIRKLRASEKERAAELKAGREAAAKLKELEDKDLGEKERLQKQLDEANARATKLEAQHREIRLHSEIERAARKLGAVDEEAVIALLDKGQLELDDDGKPTNAEKVVKDLLEKRSYLKSDGTKTKGEPIPNTPRGGGNGAGGSERVEKTKEELRGTGKYNL